MMDGVKFCELCVQGMYMLTAFVLGLDLLVDFLSLRREPITLVMKLAGVIILFFCASITVGGFLCCVFPDYTILLKSISRSLDIFILFLACLMGPTLYSGHMPSKGSSCLIGIPFIAGILCEFIFPQYGFIASVGCILCFLLYTAYWAIMDVRKDRIAPHIYSYLENRYARWFVVFPVLGFFDALIYGYFVLRGDSPLGNVVYYSCQTIFLIYIFRQVYVYRPAENVQIEKNLSQIINQQPLELQSVSKRQQMREMLEELMTKDKLYLNANLSVDDLVNRIGTNTTDFYFFMRDEMHTRFYDYINSLRIDYARQLLLNPDVRISEVANQSGFNSPQSFSRTFHTIAGCTPTEWRIVNRK